MGGDMRLKSAILAALVFAFFVSIIKVSANWYAGAQLSNVYGVWAYIQAPVNPLHIYDLPGVQSGTSNWVSLPQPNWIQTGWNYYNFDNVPKQFVETCINGCNGPPARYYHEFGDHNWGATVSYMVEYQPGSGNIWCAYIGGIQKYCQAILIPPTTGQGLSEIQYNNLNEMDTYFNNVYYKNSSYVWQVFDQNETLYHDFPYTVQVFQPWNYHNFRLKLVYLPVAMK
jgi:hypothetical protein